MQRISDLWIRASLHLDGLRNQRRSSPNDWQDRQDEFMRKCFASHGVRLTGVLHVGGHFGEEYPIYKAAGAQRVVFFEPMPHIFMELRRRFGSHEDVTLVKQALGSKRETLRMHVNRFAGESSSFLRPSALYDGFFRRSRLSLSVDTLDAALLALGGPSGFDLLVTDTQGFDLEVLRGAKKALDTVDYVYTEVSQGHYQGEPTVADFDSFLSPLGFFRVEQELYGSWKGRDRWGDLFYAKQKARQ